VGFQLLFVTGVVHGKAIKYVVAARNHATVLRSIRQSIGALGIKTIAYR